MDSSRQPYIMRLRPFACVPEKLVSNELVRQDTRGVQMCAEEERRKRAARIDLSHYNQALVTHTHTRTNRSNHPLMWTLKAQSSWASLADRLFSGGKCKIKRAN